MNVSTYDAGDAWKQSLSHEGYEHHCSSIEDFRRIKRFGLIWRKILQITKLPPSSHLFELGCGGVLT